MYFPIIDVLKENFIEKIPSIVTQWLTNNVNPVGSAVVVDTSLSISGAAADAKVTGDKISDLKSDLSTLPITFTDGGLVNQANYIYAVDTYSYSNYFDVMPGQKIKLTSRLSGDAKIVFTKADKTTVTQYISGPSNTYYSDVITVPAESAFLRFSCIKAYKDSAKIVFVVQPSIAYIYANIAENASNISTNAANITALQTETNSIKSDVYAEVNFDFLNPTSTAAFVNNAGTVVANQSYTISRPFTVKKGDKIAFTGQGSLTNVAMISVYSGGTYTPKAVSIDSTVRLYEYTAEADCQIALSYRSDKNHACTISGTTFVTTDAITNEVNKPDFSVMFTRLAVIGDSLSSGELVTPKTGGGYVYTDVYGQSWLSYLSRSINASARTHYARGGQTAKTWLEEYLTKMNTDTPFGAYFIALGTNDKREDVSGYGLGTISDTAGTDSFVGYYKQIIEAVTTHAPNAVIFCVSLYDEASATNIAYDEMISDIADLYSNCFYVDYANKADITKDIGGAYISDGHWTSVGYPRVAQNIRRIISEIVSENLTYFKFYTLNNAVGNQFET